MQFPKLNFKSYLALAIPLLVTLTLTIFLQRTLITNPDAIKTWLASFGIFAIFAYIIIQSATIIIAPLGGAAAAIAVIALFGPIWGNILIYLVCTPLYIINFLIAKKFGRRVVKKLVGDKGIKIVDKYSAKISVTVLIFMKILLGGYFDFISYAVGLTKIPVKTFVVINILGGIPFLLLSMVVFTFSPNFTTAVFISYFVIPLTISAFYLPFHRRLKKYLQTSDLIPQEL